MYKVKLGDLLCKTWKIKGRNELDLLRAIQESMFCSTVGKRGEGILERAADWEEKGSGADL